ncbi:hypothetical protein KHDHEBDM_03695 [Pectobacterium polaris]|nr:hypothetical protein KHDHEBDM_03695 [Pectobacterium polaris]
MKPWFENEMNISVRFGSIGEGLGSTTDRKLHLHRLSLRQILCRFSDLFVRYNTAIPCHLVARARHRASQSPSPCEPWLLAKLCRYAMPSSVSGLTDRLRHAPDVAQA